MRAYRAFKQTQTLHVSSEAENALGTGDVNGSGQGRRGVKRVLSSAGVGGREEGGDGKARRIVGEEIGEGEGMEVGA